MTEREKWENIFLEDCAEYDKKIKGADMEEEQKAEEYIQGIEGDDCVILTDRAERKQAFIAGYHECQKEHEWHYIEKDEFPCYPNMCIRCVFYNGDEHICYTEYYQPSEDEIGYGGLVVVCVCNGEMIDENNIKMWHELPVPPKEIK